MLSRGSQVRIPAGVMILSPLKKYNSGSDLTSLSLMWENKVYSKQFSTKTQRRKPTSSYRWIFVEKLLLCFQRYRMLKTPYASLRKCHCGLTFPKCCRRKNTFMYHATSSKTKHIYWTFWDTFEATRYKNGSIWSLSKGQGANLGSLGFQIVSLPNAVLKTTLWGPSFFSTFALIWWRRDEATAAHSL